MKVIFYAYQMEWDINWYAFTDLAEWSDFDDECLEPRALLDKKDQQKYLVATPNPTSGNFTISGINENDVVSIYVTDIFVVKKYAAVQSSFEIEDIPNGLYLLHILSSKGTIDKLKIIITKS